MNEHKASPVAVFLLPDSTGGEVTTVVHLDSHGMGVLSQILDKNCYPLFSKGGT